MNKGFSREPAGGLVILAAAALFVAGTGWAGQRPAEDTPAPAAPARIVLDASPGSRAMEPLLARLWDSGFFRRNDAVLREILNNHYAFLGPGGPVPPTGSKGLGCYAHTPGDQDVIFLRRDLFSRFEIDMEGVTVFEDTSRRILPVLVHEICHDLWMNILDDRERAAFAREGEDLMDGYCLAQSADGRQLFLLRYGDDIADPRCRRSYAEIEALRDARMTRPVCAHELFSWLAERLFMTKRAIPRPLQKYYSCILAGVPCAAAGPVR